MVAVSDSFYAGHLFLYPLLCNRVKGSEPERNQIGETQKLVCGVYMAGLEKPYQFHVELWILSSHEALRIGTKLPGASNARLIHRAVTVQPEGLQARTTADGGTALGTRWRKVVSTKLGTGARRMIVACTRWLPRPCSWLRDPLLHTRWLLPGTRSGLRAELLFRLDRGGQATLAGRGSNRRHPIAVDQNQDLPA